MLALTDVESLTVRLECQVNWLGKATPVLWGGELENIKVKPKKWELGNQNCSIKVKHKSTELETPLAAQEPFP